MAKKPDQGTLVLDEFLCFAVYSLGHAFNRAYKPLLEALDLTYPQYVAMVVLWQFGWGTRELLDIQPTGSIGEFVPLTVFAILLAMSWGAIYGLWRAGA